MLLPLTVPSLVAAFLGGLLVLGGQAYFVLTGLLLVAAAVLMVFKQAADTVEARPVPPGPAAAVGAGAGFISGLTGVGGGVFLTPLLIALGWATPKRAAQLSPPFILCNSILGLGGVLLAGQQLASGTFLLHRRARGSRHWHGRRSALDVGTWDAIRPCGDSTVRRNPAAIPLGPRCRADRFSCHGRPGGILGRLG